jgi:hypothetical protein
MFYDVSSFMNIISSTGDFTDSTSGFGRNSKT